MNDWSEKLEQQALKYAKQIARTNNYKHSNTKDGENLACFMNMKNGIFIQICEMAWYDEIKDYKYSKIKRFRIGFRK